MREGDDQQVDRPERGTIANQGVGADRARAEEGQREGAEELRQKNLSLLHPKPSQKSTPDWTGRKYKLKPCVSKTESL
jgi:hypothetical protein